MGTLYLAISVAIHTIAAIAVMFALVYAAFTGLSKLFRR